MRTEEEWVTKATRDINSAYWADNPAGAGSREEALEEIALAFVTGDQDRVDALEDAIHDEINNLIVRIEDIKNDVPWQYISRRFGSQKDAEIYAKWSYNRGYEESFANICKEILEAHKIAGKVEESDEHRFLIELSLRLAKEVDQKLNICDCSEDDEEAAQHINRGGFGGGYSNEDFGQRINPVIEEPVNLGDDWETEDEETYLVIDHGTHTTAERLMPATPHGGAGVEPVSPAAWRAWRGCLS